MVLWGPDFNVKPQRCSGEFCHVMALLYLEMRLRLGEGLAQPVCATEHWQLCQFFARLQPGSRRCKAFCSCSLRILLRSIWQIEGPKVSFFRTDVSSMKIMKMLTPQSVMFSSHSSCPRSGRIDPRVSPALERSVNLSGCLEMWNVTPGDTIPWICSFFNCLMSCEIPVACTRRLFCYSFVILVCCQVTAAFCPKPWLQKTNQQQLGTQLGGSTLQKGGLFVCLVH